jgi:hypothetical protein
MGKGRARQAVCSLTQALPVEVCPRSAAVFYSLFLRAGGGSLNPHLPPEEAKLLKDS